MDLSDTSASMYSNDEPLIVSRGLPSPQQRYEPLVPSRKPPSPRRRETRRNTMDRIERELNDFARYEDSQTTSNQRWQPVGNEVGRQSLEDWPLRVPWTQRSRGDDSKMKEPGFGAVQPTPRQRKPHSGSHNHEPTIQEDEVEQHSRFTVGAQADGCRRDLKAPQQIDRSQHRKSMLIEQARFGNHWTPEQLIDNYSRGWEPGSGSPQHQPLDLRQQAMLDTRDSIGYGDAADFPQGRYAAYPDSRSPSVYSTSETRSAAPERSMSDGLPPSLLPPGTTTHRFSPPLCSSLPAHVKATSSWIPPEAYEPQSPLSPWLGAICASPLLEPESKIPSLPETTSSSRPARVRSLPSPRRSNEGPRLWGGTARSSTASSILEQARPVRTSANTVGPSGVMLGEIPVQRWLDGVWRAPANVEYSIRDPRMRPPNYGIWEPQACGGWF